MRCAIQAATVDPTKRKSDRRLFAVNRERLAAILLTIFLSCRAVFIRRLLSFGIAEMRILLVEDHPESRRALKRLIEQRGHEVQAVASAEEAEVEMGKHPFPF